jgi:membrane protease YdiL (CAAX protease family)
MNNNPAFFNSVGRLRSGWRFAIFAFTCLSVSIFFGFLILVATQIATNDQKATFLNTPAGFFITSVISTFLATLLGWLCGKLLEGLPFKALGWVFNKTWLKDYLLGMILGITTIAFAAILAMPVGGISFSFNQTSDLNSILLTIATSFAVFFIAAAFEEVLFRGYVLQTLARANLAWLGILLTSLPFAIVHMNNPNASLISSLNTGLAGVWLGLAYLKTRSLWLAFGLHLAWNWFQGAFFGLPVSGLSQMTPNPLLQSADHGPTWLTGGEYGVEGGIVCTIALIASTAIIWYLPIFRATEEMLALTDRENPKTLRNENYH